MPRGTKVSLLVVLDAAPHGRLWSATGNASQRAALDAPRGSLWSATGNASQRAALTEADACDEDSEICRI